MPSCTSKGKHSRPLSLPAGAVLAAVAIVLPGTGAWALGGDELSIDTDRSVVRVEAGGQPVLSYQYIPRPAKPYLKQWFSPGGVNVLRDAPADHLHHHGLMFAVAVDEVDFWSERPDCGTQRHKSLDHVSTYTRDKITWATFTHTIEWTAPESEKILLQETRKIDTCRLSDPAATVCLWTTSLAVPPGNESVRLSGSPYFGLGMRFVPSMDTSGTFRNADGQTGVDPTNGARSAWCAYSAEAGGQPVTVAMFDHPANARHPATWFTMDSRFAYLAVTLNLNREPLVVEVQKPLKLRYAAAVWDGPVEPGRIESLSKSLMTR